MVYDLGLGAYVVSADEIVKDADGKVCTYICICSAQICVCFVQLCICLVPGLCACMLFCTDLSYL